MEEYIMVWIIMHWYRIGNTILEMLGNTWNGTEWNYICADQFHSAGSHGALLKVDGAPPFPIWSMRNSIECEGMKLGLTDVSGNGIDGALLPTVRCFVISSCVRPLASCVHPILRVRRPSTASPRA